MSAAIQAVDARKERWWFKALMLAEHDPGSLVPASAHTPVTAHGVRRRRNQMGRLGEEQPGQAGRADRHDRISPLQLNQEAIGGIPAICSITPISASARG